MFYDIPGFRLTRAQTKALDALTSDATHCALGGGSRCVAGGTILDGHTLTVAELAQTSSTIPVRTTYGTQWVDPPVRKGTAPLVTVTTSTGRSVTVTPDHRFWDGSQWTSQISPGSIVACDPNPPRSNEAPALQGWLAGVRRWMGTVSGWGRRCWSHPRRYDPQLRPSSTDVQEGRALLSGEQVRNLFGLSHDDLASLLPGSDSRTHRLWSLDEVYTRIGQEYVHPSSSGGSPVAGLPFVSSALFVLQTFAQSRLLRPFRWRSSPAPAHSGAHQSLSYSDTPVDSYVMEEVVSVKTDPTPQDYYTLHVPSTEQYYANGILHHNSGKTALLVLCVLTRALKAADSRHVIFRFRLNALISSVVLDTLPKMMKLKWPGLWECCKMNRQDNYLRLPNGSEIWFAGLDDKDRTEKILGMEFATIYFNECSQIPFGSVTLALTRLAQKTSLSLKAYYDFNPPSKVHWTYLTFVRKLNPENKKALKREHDYAFYLINPADNRENLDSKYLDMLDSLPEKARNRFLLGRFADDSDGALWTEELLAQNRILGREGEVPDFIRVVIAVDPSGCSGAEDTRSDEVGIAVVAVGVDGDGYLLEDLSGKYSPEQWSNIVNAAFERHKADMVVGEKNFGGDMVRAVLQAQNSELPYKEVTATRGKIARAEPIAALYEKQRIHHIGYFPELEDQLCAMTTAGYQGLRSPDRADACLGAGTRVTTRAGDKAIEDVSTSDFVLTRTGWHPVSWAGMTRPLARVHDVIMSDGTVVTATSEHPFFTQRGWVPVDSLIWGDIMHHITENSVWHRLKLHFEETVTRASRDTIFAPFARLFSGKTSTNTRQKRAHVHVVQVIERDERPVYNLHVDGPHEFFANGILVHNCLWGFSELFHGMVKSQKDRDWTPPPTVAYNRSASRYDRR